MEVQDWLRNTTAADVMIKEVVTLQPDQRLADAAATFLRHEISGAPVVDSRGACVGVLSASDVLAAEEQVENVRREISSSPFWNSELALPPSIYQEKLAEVRDQLAPAAEQPVKRFMTEHLISVTESQSLDHVVQQMVAAHIHRVVVLGAGRALRGSISTTDVLVALLRESHPAAAL